MTTISSVATVQESGFKAFAKRYPLISYFALAYALTWIFVIPIMLSQRGPGVINLPESFLLVFLLVSTYSGTLPAALIMTTLIDGKEGRRHSKVFFRWLQYFLVGTFLLFLDETSGCTRIAQGNQRGHQIPAE